MGRKFLLITAILIVGADLSLAQGRRSRHADFGRGNHEMRAAPARTPQLSAEERQTFRKNAERWLKMNQQQREALRQLERDRRERLKNEADTALSQSGLRLDQKAREQFESRYFQERRKIERSLREEFESKKQQELPQLNERLKNEFQPQGSGSPAVSLTPGR